MKLDFLSDLHLEFGTETLEGGEVLLLAGDVCVADYLRKERTDKYARRHRARYEQFFKEECAKYEKVYYVMGNHEHYSGRFDRTESLLREALKDTNVELLQNQVVKLTPSWSLFGSTFWTDLNKGDYFAIQAAKTHMNDFKEIEVEKKVKLTPTVTMSEHEVALWRLGEVLESLEKGENLIVMSHHAPHFGSIAERYRGSLLNYSYYSDKERLILDNPQIKYWLHGHVHTDFDYEIGECRVLCNPRGYVGVDTNKHYAKKKTIELT